MSTRYIKKDTNVIVGLAKNGSQAIKQIHLRNEGWERLEEENNWDQVDNFIGTSDSNVTVYFPVRDPYERAKSEYIQRLRDWYRESGEPEPESFMHKHMENFESYTPYLNYYASYVGKFFIENILLNDEWNGCKIKFFDLSKLSVQFNKYLGYNLEIPLYNVWQEDGLKRIIYPFLKNDHHILNRVFTQNWKEHYSNFEKPFWERIKKTKYWLEL